MSSHSAAGLDRSTEFLRRFVRRRKPEEHCEMCGQALEASHQHLLEIQSRRLLCACEACAMLFSSQGETRLRRVPRRSLLLRDFQLSEAQWDDLRIPINMAFFYNSTPNQRVEVMYPSPAGATEALLPQQAWNEIAAANPILTTMEPDVEALLANRVPQARGEGGAEYFVTPIDQCFKLVGLIRMNWKGLSGGTEVWQEIGRFFAELRNASNPIGGHLNA